MIDKQQNNIDKAIKIFMFITCLVFVFGMQYLLFSGVENPFIYL